MYEQICPICVWYTAVYIILYSWGSELMPGSWQLPKAALGGGGGDANCTTAYAAYELSKKDWFYIN